MYTQELKDKFIELRAKGLSLSKISEKLNITKRTLVEWNRQYHSEIHSLRLIAHEELKERILVSQEADLIRLSQQLERVEAQITQHSLRFVPIHTLFRIADRLRAQINRTTPAPDPFTPEPIPNQNPVPVKEPSFRPASD